MSKLKTGNPQILGIISLVPARRQVVPWSTYSVVCTLSTNTVTSTRLQNYLHTTAVWSRLATWHIGNVWHFVKLSLAKILFSANFPRHLSHFDLVCWRGLSGFEQVITDVPMWHICHFWHVTHCHIWHDTHCHIWHVTSCHLSFVKLVKYDMSHAKLFYPTQLLCPMLNFSIYSLMLTSKMVFFQYSSAGWT